MYKYNRSVTLMPLLKPCVVTVTILGRPCSVRHLCQTRAERLFAHLVPGSSLLLGALDNK